VRMFSADLSPNLWWMAMVVDDGNAQNEVW
jgi:hypothetical protein